MKKIYIVHMEEDMEDRYDRNAYVDRDKVEERMNELISNSAAWYYEIEEFDLFD